MPTNHVNTEEVESARRTLLETALAALRAAQVAINQEIGAYPAPIPACDAQFNGLLEERRRLSQAIRYIDAAMTRGDIQSPTGTDLKRLGETVRRIDADLATRLLTVFPEGPNHKSSPR